MATVFLVLREHKSSGSLNINSLTTCSLQQAVLQQGAPAGSTRRGSTQPRLLPAAGTRPPPAALVLSCSKKGSAQARGRGTPGPRAGMATGTERSRPRCPAPPPAAPLGFPRAARGVQGGGACHSRTQPCTATLGTSSRRLSRTGVGWPRWQPRRTAGRRIAVSAQEKKISYQREELSCRNSNSRLQTPRGGKGPAAPAGALR